MGEALGLINQDSAPVMCVVYWFIRLPQAHILPSYLRRKSCSGTGSKPKKSKTVQSWDRDIICLPLSRRNYSSSSTIAYPRGRYRSELGSMGLIGKLHLTSEMTEADIKQEIRTIFQGPMGGDPTFPFVFLQPAGEGSRSLIIPAQSSTYRWTAQQVARLGGQKNTTYILAQADMPSLNFNVSDTNLNFSISDMPVNYLFLLE